MWHDSQSAEMYFLVNSRVVRSQDEFRRRYTSFSVLLRVAHAVTVQYEIVCGVGCAPMYSKEGVAFRDYVIGYASHDEPGR